MQIKVYEGARRSLLPLFRSADESEKQIRSYYELGNVLVASERDSIIGMIHIMEDAGEWEIVSLAVVPQCQGQGTGRRLVEEALTYCRRRNVTRIVVCTGSWETNNIIFYLRRGFRIFNVARDYFTPEKGYALAIRDQVQFEMYLE